MKTPRRCYPQRPPNSLTSLCGFMNPAGIPMVKPYETPDCPACLRQLMRSYAWLLVRGDRFKLPLDELQVVARDTFGGSEL